MFPKTFRAAGSGALLLCTLCFSVARAADDPVIAVVNGAEIHQSELTASRASAPAKVQGMDEAAINKALLDQLVTAKAIMQEAEKLGTSKDPAFKKFLAQRTEQALLEFYVQGVVAKKVTDKAVRDLYDSTVTGAKAPEEYKARHILVETEDQAKDIIKQIKGGKDFAALAKEKSKDPGSGQNGGDLGWFTAEMMVPEFSNAAVALKNGDISAPVKSQFGWHVIQTQERRKQPAPKFDDVKENLGQQLRQQTTQELVANVRKAAKIELKGAAAAPQIVPVK